MILYSSVKPWYTLHPSFCTYIVFDHLMQNQYFMNMRGVAISKFLSQWTNKNNKYLFWTLNAYKYHIYQGQFIQTNKVYYR